MRFVGVGKANAVAEVGAVNDTELELLRMTTTSMRYIPTSAPRLVL